MNSPPSAFLRLDGSQRGDGSMWLDEEVAVVGKHEKVYYLRSGHQGVLVDCGSEATYRENLEALSGDGVDPKSITALLVTHEHFDHIGAIGRARAELGCPVIAHRLAAEAIELGDPLVTASEMRFLGTHVPFLPAAVDHVVDDGDTIQLGSDSIEVHHIPGHTPGGVAYLFKGRLIVGDTVFLNGGIGWPDIHWGSNLADHRESVEKIERISPQYLLPGHGDAGQYSSEISRLALEKLAFLESAEVASVHTRSTGGGTVTGEPRSVSIDGLSRRSEPRSPASLRLSASYEFGLNDLFGFVRPWGPFHGLALFGSGGVPVTQVGKCTLNLEHYLSRGAAAPFLPRNGCAKFHAVDKDSIWIEFSPTSEWPVRSRIRYELQRPNVVDVTFRFEFGRSFRDFEVFVASYFHRGQLPFVHTMKGWARPRVEGRQHVFVARDDESAAQIVDGRWNWVKEGGIEIAIHPERYRSAVLVDWDEHTGWAFVQAADPNLCPAISMNAFCWAQDLSLVGRDVAAGESVETRCRAVYQRIEDLEEVEDIYQTFLEAVQRRDGDQS